MNIHKYWQEYLLTIAKSDLKNVKKIFLVVFVIAQNTLYFEITLLITNFAKVFYFIDHGLLINN